MEEKLARLENFLSCHVCLETLRDPLSLICNHSFCSSCLQHVVNKNCPMCKRKSSEGTFEKCVKFVRFAQREVADYLAGRREAEPSGTERGERTLVKECKEHQEELKLFCKDEDRAVCSVCEFSLHKSHEVIPTKKAVKGMKEQLRSDLRYLQDKKKDSEGVKKIYDGMIQECKKQTSFTERQIRAEFNKLHQFLREEEESRLAALREEEEHKVETIGREMKKVQDQVSARSDSISAVEEDLRKDHVSFLSSYKSTQTRARAQCAVSDPQLVSGALIDVAQHLGNLSFRVWEKMKEKVHFSPVILDPNSAGPWLYLSDDLTSVRNRDTWQQVPDNPERHTNAANVLGSEGFSSGKHSWEVEVGDHPGWNIGLMRQSADRKGKRFASPEYGIWCLYQRSGEYDNGAGQTVPVKKRVQRLRVQLDYDRGEVSFYDAEDNTHIYTHKDTFTEKLFPYFNVCKAGDAETTDLKICPTDISLSY